MVSEMRPEQLAEAMKRCNEADKNFKPNIKKLTPSIAEKLKKIIKGAK